MNFNIRTIVSSFFLLTTTSIINAEELIYDYYGVTSTEIPNLPTFEEKPLNNGFERQNIYLYNSQTNSVRKVSAQFPITSNNQNSWIIDPATKKLSVFQSGGDNHGIRHVLDPVTNTWTKECETDNTYEWYRVCDVKIPDGGFTINNESKTSLKIGDSSNPTVISENGMSGIITRDSSTGITKIGENSFNFQEFSGSQPLKIWGTNASGKIVPINIIDKLLINGRDVEQSIDNVGALSAALTGLPTFSTDSQLTCGIGTGTHSGNYAFSGGCASKINKNLSFNAAASFVPGQDYQGKNNSYSARAGFVFKLGKTSKKELISKKEKYLYQKVSNLEIKNKELESFIAKQNLRLEKLEEIAIALKLKKNLNVISMAE